MGSVLGREDAEVLSYEIIKDAPGYEIRVYEQQPVVQTEWHKDSKATFFSLAGYIGAFEEPENEASQKIAMTTPVECLAETEKFTVMRFFPPKDHHTADSMPAPLSPSLEIKVLPRRVVAARRFSGSVDLNQPKSDPALRPHLLHLLRTLINDGLLKTDKPCATDEAVWQQLDSGDLKDVANGETIRWSLAVYNSPFCLPFFRRNEVWVSLSSEGVQQK